MKKRNPTKESLRFMDDIRFIGGVAVTTAHKKAAMEAVAKHRAKLKKKKAA